MSVCPVCEEEFDAIDLCRKHISVHPLSIIWKIDPEKFESLILGNK